MAAPLIRLATVADLPAINRIYNHYVLQSTCTYQTEPDTLADRSEWFAAHGAGYPITVAEREGAVVGWGALSQFRPRAAYAPTVENSVYVDADLHRQGIGGALLADLIERGRAARYHSIVAGIDAEQAASVALHTAFGFKKVGALPEVGFKFNRWLHVIYMQLML